jgi:hypothetical protein
MSVSIEKAKPSTAREVAASLKALADQLTGVVSRLKGTGDDPVPANAAKQVAEIASALRQLVEPTPPSATATEKHDGARADDGWPRDMAAGSPNELTWGADPEALRHG